MLKYLPQGFTEVKVQDAPELSTEVLLPMADEAVLHIDNVRVPAVQSHQFTTPKGVSASPEGQIRIDIGGCQITADGSYPMDKLVVLLRELMRP